MNPLPVRPLVAATGLAVLAATGLTACTQPSAKADPKTVTVWNLDGQPDRMAAVKKINAAFTARTGITIEEVAVQENQLPSLITSAAVSGTMPDLISGLPLAYLRQLKQQKLLDTKAASQVVAKLGPATFAAKALELTRDGNNQLGVPSDAWTQILAYRKDLFAAKNLAPPTTYEAIEKAAQALTSGNQYGITLATDPSDPFTQQTFESLALGNNCQMVEQGGSVALDSPACRQTFALYGTLAQKDSPQGIQTVDSTRATYFAGQAAMTIWSTFLLDEMGGLRHDALPTCKQCEKDPTWLARNTGIVTALRGPQGSQPVGYGEIATWGILAGARPAASSYVQYMMSDGYKASLAIAPEGKFPMRSGDAADPKKFVNAWPTLPAGVDTKKPLVDIYGKPTMDQISKATGTLERWAIPQGQGDLLGPTVAELAIPKALASLAIGESPNQTAKDATSAVEEIQRSLK
jgi:multiple sugar transport system substrate-binding protein